MKLARGTELMGADMVLETDGNWYSCDFGIGAGEGIEEMRGLKTVWAKSILRLSAQPETIQTECPGANAEFSTRVHFNVPYTAAPYLLDDETFPAVLISRTDPLSTRLVVRFDSELRPPFLAQHPEFVAVDHAEIIKIAQDTDRYETENPTGNGLQFFYDRVTELAIKAGARAAP